MDLLLPFVLGLLPIIWLVVALVGLKMQAPVAAAGALVVAAVLAVAYWHMSAINLATAPRWKACSWRCGPSSS